MKIAIPEYSNPIMKKAIKNCPDLDFVPADDLAKACDLLGSGAADALVAGIDITTRDMVLTCKDKLDRPEKYFSSCFVMQKDGKKMVIADAGVNKNPNVEIFKAIITQSYQTATKVLDEEPRVAMLSFSTLGSGGGDSSIDKIHEAMEWVKNEHPEIIIDGEMQLDVAVDPIVGVKKAPGSPVAGKANVLICPDLNSGNILYKAMERLGGWTAAGPILQGFGKPISDLSRGSTAEDVELVFRTLEKLNEGNEQ